MQDWLTKQGVHWDSKMTKHELFDKIKQHKDSRKKFVIDTIAEENGFHVLRLPPYHCELNPIEMVWAQVKSYVKDKNTTFKVKDVELLTNEALEHVTPEQWHTYCDHVKKEEGKMWQLEGLMDTVCDRLIVELGEEDSDSDSDSNEDKSDTDSSESE